MNPSSLISESVLVLTWQFASIKDDKMWNECLSREVDTEDSISVHHTSKSACMCPSSDLVLVGQADTVQGAQRQSKLM